MKKNEGVWGCPTRPQKSECRATTCETREKRGQSVYPQNGSGK